MHPMINPESTRPPRSSRGRFVIHLAILAAAVLVVGCGVRNARASGVAASEQLRELLNAERYAEIYKSATPQFRQAPEQQWVAFCREMHRKLGQWKASPLKDTQVILVDSGGYMVHVIYTTDFYNGSATE